MGIEIEATKFEIIPMGEYEAEIKSLTQEEGQFGPQLKFFFEIVAPDEYAEQNLVGWCSATYNPKSKLWAWYHAALGNDADDEMFYGDQLIGRRVRIGVSVKTNDQGVERNKVETILPLKKTTGHWFKDPPQRRKFNKFLEDHFMDGEDVNKALGSPVIEFKGSCDEALALLQKYAER